MRAPIAILTPSRDRMDQLAEMIDATLSTADGDVDIYIAVDTDDPADYSKLCQPHVFVNRGQRKQLGPWTNALAAWTWNSHQILASFGDDHRPRTQGWDARVTEAFAQMGAGLVYTADGLQDERLPTAPFWSASIIRQLGWFFPPNQKHLYADDVWLAFARALGRCTYLPDVLIEHLHPSSGKSKPDQINAANDSHYGADGDAYRRYLASSFRGDVDRVRGTL